MCFIFYFSLEEQNGEATKIIAYSYTYMQISNMNICSKERNKIDESEREEESKKRERK